SIAMPSVWFAILFFLVVSYSASCEDWCKVDQSNHDCRSCRDILISSLDNCPETGYDCDEKQLLSTSDLIASDACGCLSLRCANSGWRLAVNRTIVDKVRCNGGHWFSSGSAAPSFVCAKVIPSAPEQCTKFVAAQKADITVGPPGLYVPGAIVTADSMSCPLGADFVILDMSEIGGGQKEVKDGKTATCVNGKWIADKGGVQSNLEDPPAFVPPVFVACLE
ncbi:hypothetical protein PENTCL1PPCAC_19331, partial [Pristionchus entomophagus]